MSWPEENNQDKALKIILFAISPFIATIYSLKTMNRKSSYLVFFMFAIFFGMSFTVQSGKTIENRTDGASYRQKFNRYLENENYYDYHINEDSFNEGDVKDFYFDTIAFLVAQITDNYHILFMIIAIVFAYFALKSFRFLTQEPEFVASSYICLLLVFLFFDNHIFNINGVRFWTAAWVGVYSIFQIFQRGNSRYLILALLTPLIHGSFWLFVFIVLLGYLNNKKFKIWTYLFYFSFILSLISIGLVRNAIEYLPAFLQKMAGFYVSEEHIDKMTNRSNTYFYVNQFFSYAVKIFINIIVWVFIKNEKIINSNSRTSKLFPFLLIWMTFVNFLAPIPSLGDRFFSLSFPIIAYIWLVSFSNQKYKNLLKVIPFVFSIEIYKLLLHYSEVTNLQFYFSSPIYLIYKYLIIA